MWRCPSNTGFCCYPKQSLSFTHVWLALTISNQLRTVRFRRKVALFYDHSGVGIICHFQLELTKTLSLCTQVRKICGYNWTFLTWHSLGKFTKSHRVTLVQLKCDFGQSKDPGDYTRLLAKQLYKCILLVVRKVWLKFLARCYSSSYHSELGNFEVWCAKKSNFWLSGGVDANHDLIHQRKVVLESNIAAPKFVDLVNRALPISLKTSNAPSSALLTQFNYVSYSGSILLLI